MNIDPKNVHITEKEIEDWLWEHPELVPISSHSNSLCVDKWLVRQYTVNSGRIDLLGVWRNFLVVVEIKNKTIDSSALTQVCRYAQDVDSIKYQLEKEYCAAEYGDPYIAREEPSIYNIDVLKVVVGAGDISNQLFYEANALNIRLVIFNVEYSLRIDKPLSWGDEYAERMRENKIASANDDVFQLYKRHCEKIAVIEEAERITAGDKGEECQTNE